MEETTKDIYCVYKHTNLKNGKVYIGITSRKPEVRWGNGNGYYSNKHFYNAIKKYGWEEGFSHEIIAENLSKEDANNFEIKLIKEYDSTNPSKGYNVNLGGNTYGQHSEKTKLIISEKQYKPLYQYNRHTGEFIKRFGSTLEAEKELNIPNADISAVCNKKMKTSHNFVFRYESDENVEYGKPLSKEELEIINRNGSRVKVGKFDQNHNLIEEFDMAKDAVFACKVGTKKFYEKILDKDVLYNGYIWKRLSRRGDEEFKSLYKQQRKVIQQVAQYSSIDGLLLKVFKDIGEASDKTGVKTQYIMNSCRGRHYTAGGYIWKYVDENCKPDEKIESVKEKKQKDKLINNTQ